MIVELPGSGTSEASMFFLDAYLQSTFFENAGDQSGDGSALDWDQKPKYYAVRKTPNAL
jgi:hypothetical protein